VQAKSIGVDLAPLRSWSERVLDEALAPTGLQRSDVERAYQIASKESVSVQVSVDICDDAESAETGEAPEAEAPEADEPADAGEVEAAAAPAEQPAECNLVLALLLAGEGALQSGVASGDIDVSLLGRATELLTGINDMVLRALAEAGANGGQADTTSDTATPPIEAEIAMTGHATGEDKYASLSVADLSDADIREIVRDVVRQRVSKRQ
jgi:hypothetical protein